MMVLLVLPRATCCTCSQDMRKFSQLNWLCGRAAFGRLSSSENLLRLRALTVFSERALNVQACFWTLWLFMWYPSRIYWLVLEVYWSGTP
eukprot:6112613-Amphidinium_carterae.1